MLFTPTLPSIEVVDVNQSYQLAFSKSTDRMEVHFFEAHKTLGFLKKIFDDIQIATCFSMV